MSRGGINAIYRSLYTWVFTHANRSITLRDFLDFHSHFKITSGYLHYKKAKLSINMGTFSGLTCHLFLSNARRFYLSLKKNKRTKLQFFTLFIPLCLFRVRQFKVINITGYNNSFIIRMYKSESK